MNRQRHKIWETNQELLLKLQNKHIFLTGGTGFFGKSYLDLINFFNHQYDLNLKTTILTRDPDKFKTEFPELTSDSRLFFQKGDIVDFKFSDEYFDSILHFATPASVILNRENPIEMLDVILNGQKQILEFAKIKKIKTVLFASSGAVYGKQPSELLHVTEDFSGAPLSNSPDCAYGLGKRTAEALGNFYADKYAFEHKIARCFTFIGPYLDLNGSYALSNFLKNALESQDIIIQGDGTDTRSYLYSDDLIIALLHVLVYGKNKQPYNVGSDQPVGIKSLAELIIKNVNPKLKIEIKKQTVAGPVGNVYLPSINLLKNELHYKPSYSLEEGIKHTVEYIKDKKI